MLEVLHEMHHPLYTPKVAGPKKVYIQPECIHAGIMHLVQTVLAMCPLIIECAILFRDVQAIASTLY